MILITDSPHAAGTPEHSEWVRKVFIPTVSSERAAIDRAKHGAESIGGKLVYGPLQDLFTRTATGVSSLGGAFRAFADAQVQAVHLPDWVYQLVDTEEIDRILATYGVAAAPRRLPMPQPNRAERRNQRLPPSRPPRECPRHGGPAATCRPCQRQHS